MPERIRGVLSRAVDTFSRPTDQQIVARFLDHGIKTVVSVPCSITDTMDSQWQDLDRIGSLRLIKATHEHSLVGIASGIFLGSGELSLVHLQNSGFTNSADGLISFARIYGIPILEMVTWRGSNDKDDSEPHQAIGELTQGLTEAVVGKRHLFGDRLGRGILRAADKSIASVRQNGLGVLRLSPDAFTKTYPLHFQEVEIDGARTLRERVETNKTKKGSLIEQVLKESPISRVQAMYGIVNRHPEAVIAFSNGYSAREAQDAVDRVGNLYNTGYMGGTLAIGWGIARSNPNIDVVVVDGDQNAQMSCMKDMLAADYPENLYWYILDNGIGASVGVSRSVPLASYYYDLARVVRTTPDLPGQFKAKRVGARGAYFSSEEDIELASQMGSLPAHALRLRHWIYQKTNHRE